MSRAVVRFWCRILRAQSLAVSRWKRSKNFRLLLQVVIGGSSWQGTETFPAHTFQNKALNQYYCSLKRSSGDKLTQPPKWQAFPFLSVPRWKISIAASLLQPPGASSVLQVLPHVTQSSLCSKSKPFPYLCVYRKDQTGMNITLSARVLLMSPPSRAIPLQPWRSLLAELEVRMDKSGLSWNSLAAWNSLCAGLPRLMQYDLYHPCCCLVVFLVKYMAISRGFKQTAEMEWAGEKYFPHLEQEKEVFVFSGSLFRERSGEEREENRSTSSLGRKRLQMWPTFWC